MKKTVAVVMLLLVSCVLAAPLFSEPLPTFPLDINDVNPLDRALMQPYNDVLDDVTTVIEYGMLAAPGAFLLVPGADWFNEGLMYAETGIITYGTGTLLKNLISRARPYTYFDSYPQSLIDEGDWDDSFPSGHTMMCFMSASFVTYMFNTRYPDSAWGLPLSAAAYALAAGTGAMRMAGGNHFLTDVLTGAALGTAIGFVIPWAHDQVKAKIDAGKAVSSGNQPSVTACLSPFSLVFSVNF